MKTVKRRGSRPETISKYLNCLTAYQQKSGKYSDLRILSKQFNTSNNFPYFLIKKEIIYKKNNGFYYWNDVYEPNIKIVNSFLDEIFDFNQTRRLKEISQTPTLFDQKRQYNRKVKIESEKVQEQSKVNEVNTAQVGVIRKFIKWLW